MINFRHLVGIQQLNFRLSHHFLYCLAGLCFAVNFHQVGKTWILLLAVWCTFLLEIRWYGYGIKSIHSWPLKMKKKAAKFKITDNFQCFKPHFWACGYCALRLDMYIFVIFPEHAIKLYDVSLYHCITFHCSSTKRWFFEWFYLPYKRLSAWTCMFQYIYVKNMQTR